VQSSYGKAEGHDGVAMAIEMPETDSILMIKEHD
jgi:hypothetical protein